jgi:hypothetical protein
MSSVAFASDERRARHLEAAAIVLACTMSLPPPVVLALGLSAALRGHGLVTVVALGSPLLTLVADWLEPWKPYGVVEATFAGLGVFAVVDAARNGGHRPAAPSSARGVWIGAASAVATAGVARLESLFDARGHDVRALTSLLAPFVAAYVSAASPRATRDYRHALREACTATLALALVSQRGAEFVPLAGLGFVLAGYAGEWSSGLGLFAVMVAGCTRVALARAVDPVVVSSLALALGLAERPLRSLAHAGFGARFRALRDAAAGLALRGARRTHRVGVALADVQSFGFSIDWHRPASQLIVERLGVLRRIPALPAPELVGALEGAPDEVASADDLHPYVVGSADVQGAARALAVRGACVAALLRDHESHEVCGVLYLLGSARAPLDRDEALELRRLADAVSASVAEGSEPAIAAHLHGA